MSRSILREFLENSTIHGLVHISTAKSHGAKAIWLAIVIACFTYAIHTINNSYGDLEKSPVSTTITTHLIDELEFPTVTVCPPRGSNTAINHILAKVKDVNFTERERQELLDLSKEIFSLDINAREMNDARGSFSVSAISKLYKTEQT